MPDVHADPDKLRQFASALSRSAQQLESIARQLQRSLDATGWQDSERQRFEQDFQQALLAELDLPPGRERALVVTKLQEACFWTKRAIATQAENQEGP